jgi:Nitrile hydratase, alpha chain
MPENGSTTLDQTRRYGELIAKAWSDPAFKARLLAEPAAMAREQGIDIPDGVPLRAIEIGPGETYLVLTSPEQPSAVTVDEPGPWLRLLIRAQSDPDYKARLMAEPGAAMAEEGIELPTSTRVTVIEPSETEGYLFVPAIPEGLDIEALDDDDVTGYMDSGATGDTCKSCWLTSPQWGGRAQLVSLFGPAIVSPLHLGAPLRRA